MTCNKCNRECNTTVCGCDAPLTSPAPCPDPAPCVTLIFDWNGEASVTYGGCKQRSYGKR